MTAEEDEATKLERMRAQFVERQDAHISKARPISRRGSTSIIQNPTTTS
jgi:hypothetical protein